MITRNDPCWCGSSKKWKKCHYPALPPGDSLSSRYQQKYGITLKTKEQIEGIAEACAVTASILDALCRHAKKGVTTEELDELCRKLHKEMGAIPAPLGYGDPPYPKAICTSLNEVICHGIPDKRPLQEGDILNIDVSSIYKGFFGDCSRMVMIGAVSDEKRRVVEVSLACLEQAISICEVGAPISRIGDVIETYATDHGCSVVNQFVGHGIGLEFHEAPEIPHHYNHVSIPMVPGMIFTIEPMINAGVREGVIDKTDGWTTRTKDGKPSAQWEHTILITENGPRILTLYEK